jgi:hypothetical protein
MLISQRSRPPRIRANRLLQWGSDGLALHIPWSQKGSSGDYIFGIFSSLIIYFLVFLNVDLLILQMFSVTLVRMILNTGASLNGNH